VMAAAKLEPRNAGLAKRAAELASRTNELGATAHVALPAAWRSPLFFSKSVVDALTLWALVHAAPHHPVVPKLVRGLLEARQGPAWRNTQENAFALLALTEYARRWEAKTPAFTASSWVGSAQNADVAFATSDASRLLSWPLVGLANGGADITLQRRGQGRLYFAAGLSYHEDETAMPTVARGLALTRTLRLRDGAVGLRGGDVAAIDVVVTNAAPLAQVAIDVPLAAGLEAIDLDMKKQAGALPLHGSRGWWVTHQELRPERVLLFADVLPPGEHHHTVFVRALTAGRFSLPAAHGEAMYAPEVNARTASARLEIAAGP
jgi:alpha-2-macroglobulin